MTDLTRALRAAYTPADQSTLDERLAGAALSKDLVEIAYRTVASPYGELLLAASNIGVLRIAFACEDFAMVLDELAQRSSPRILHAPSRLDRAARELDEFFAGRRRSFEIAVDLSLARGFRRHALDALARVAYGETVSYRELATRAGRPGAVRAAASACSHNPVPIVIPCHRVVRADGTIGEYLGGSDTKRALLQFEARVTSPGVSRSGPTP